MEVLIFIVVIAISLLVSKLQKNNKQGANRGPSPWAQKLIEQMEARQAGNQPPQVQGQFTQHAGEHLYAPAPYTPPGEYQPPVQFAPEPSNWLPSYEPPSYQPQAHRPPQHSLPAPMADTEARVRELMNAGNEVAAIRLLSDEQDMGILEAQEHARSLVKPPGTEPGSAQPPESEPVEDETRYVGSAAFAESIFDLDREENTWASGWVETPDPDDRSDIDELWQTVSNPPRPAG